MKDFKNPYIRMQSYQVWFSNGAIRKNTGRITFTEEFQNGVSMNFLSACLNVPIQVARLDIYELMEWSNGQTNLLMVDAVSEEYEKKAVYLWGKYHVSLSECLSEFVPEIYSEETDKELYEDYCQGEEIKDILQKIGNNELEKGMKKDPETGLFSVQQLVVSGILDDIPLYYERTDMEQYQIEITPKEMEAARNYLSEAEMYDCWSRKKANVYREGELCFVKQSYRFKRGHYKLLEKLKIIRQTIDNKGYLKFQYRKSAKNMREIYLKPYKILYDANENRYAVVTIEKRKKSGRCEMLSFRLEYIFDLQGVKAEEYFIRKPNQISKEEEEIQLKKLPMVWGMETSAVPVSVKVCFFNEASVWDKVKREVGFRQNARISKKKLAGEECLIYEDMVCGLSSFKAWIRKFGSSAVVMEPESLGREIVEKQRRMR